MRKCPRPTCIPTLVEGRIGPLSRSYNNAQFLVSNRTHAAKLWQYARSSGMTHEAVEDAFRLWVFKSSSIVPPHVQNKMAWFFQALRLEVLKTISAYERTEAASVPPTPQSETDGQTEIVIEEQPPTSKQEEFIQEDNGVLGVPDAATAHQEEEQVHSRRTPRPLRTREQKGARERYATQFALSFGSLE